MSEDNGHLNREILRSVDNQALPDEAKVIFDGEARPAPASKMKLWLWGLGGSALFLAAGAAIVHYRSVPTPPPGLEMATPIPLAIATAPTIPASQVQATPDIAIPASGSFAAQTVGGVENHPLPPSDVTQQPSKEPSISSPLAPQAAVIASLMQQQSVAATKPQPAPASPPQLQQQAQVKATPAPAPVTAQTVRLTPRKQEKPASIPPQSKQIQAASMRNLGIIAIMTDGLLMRRGDEEIEVVIGESVPGLGVLQRTSPKDKTVETDQRIYKLN